MARRYHILDEPTPGPMSNIVVHPLWPLLALMLGGMWLALPWFVINGYGSGSPTRVRELVIAVSGLVLTAGAVSGIIVLDGTQLLQGTSVHYALLGVSLIKLATCYLLYVIQARSFEIYVYYGGVQRSGLLVVFAAAVFARRALWAVIPWQAVRWVLS